MNPVEVARSCIKASRYSFRKEDSSPPGVVNCHTLIWWVFRQCAIEMPWGLLDQLNLGEPVERDCSDWTGCLVFTTGRWGNYRDDDRAKDGVGHVGIITESHTVVHASDVVIEEPWDVFLGNGRQLRGIYRVVPFM